MRKLNNQAIAGMTMCILIFIMMLVVGGVLMWWILQNLVSIGIGLLFIAVPIFLMVGSAILVKRYLITEVTS